MMTLRISTFLLVFCLQHGLIDSRAREKGQSLISFIILYTIDLDAGLEMVEPMY